MGMQKSSPDGIANVLIRREMLLNLVPFQAGPDNDTPELDAEDEYGFLDHLEAFDSFNSEMCAALSRIHDATGDYEQRINKHTASIVALNDDPASTSLASFKKIVKLTTDDMDRFSAVMDRQIPILSESRTEAFAALSKSLAVFRDFNVDVDAVSSLDTSLDSLRDGLYGTRKVLIDFKHTINEMPRLSTQFNRARKRVIKSLDSMADEVTTTITVTQNISDSVSELIASLK